MNNDFIEYDTYDTPARRSVGTEGGRMAAVNVWRHYEGRSRLGRWRQGPIWCRPGRVTSAGGQPPTRLCRLQLQKLVIRLMRQNKKLERLRQIHKQHLKHRRRHVHSELILTSPVPSYDAQVAVAASGSFSPPCLAGRSA